VDANGSYTITDEFKGFFEDQNFFNNGFNYDDWKDCVAHTDAGGSNTGAMESYIDANGIAEVASGVSDGNGETLYGNLDLGVYFVRSDDMIKGDFIHSFINFVYPVPILEKPEVGGNLTINYNPSASPKKSKVQRDVLTHCSIRKVWMDSGYAENRPDTVAFEIYSDGALMETVTLSADNNWTYEWSNEGIHEYNVKEISVGEGYSSEVVVEQVGAHDYAYTCTNTFTPPGDNPPPSDNPPGDTPPGDTPPGDTPPTDTPPTDTPPTNPGNPGNPGGDLPGVLGAIRNLPAVLGARRLPQTGLLWWPVPVLVIAGIAFIVKGIKKNSKNKA
ncbi:MAG: Cna B-type domain-containing protein, partial [Butyrivibrio sp.]|nr:Cna B-type domain-containing protein [Butyrivibrio sp.]